MSLSTYKLLSPEVLFLAQKAPQTVWRLGSAWTRSHRPPGWIKGVRPTEKGGKKRKEG